MTTMIPEPPDNSSLEPARSAGARPVLRKHLINKLNYVNFMEGSVDLVFRHTKTGALVRLPVRPEPCQGENLICRWSAEQTPLATISDCRLQDLLIGDANRLIRVGAQLQDIAEGLVRLKLPEAGLEIDSRRARRYLCQGVRVQMVQNSMLFAGSLTDFNACSFSVRIELAPPQTFRWIDPDAEATLFFLKDDQVIYSGGCRILRHVCRNHSGQFVFAPRHNCLHRYAAVEHRSERIALSPSPDICFCHPLSGQWLTLNVKDISGLGCAVETESDLDVLIPGMVISDIRLLFADGLCVPFKAQVIYRNGNGRARYGLAILDMALDDHVRLLNLIHRVGEPFSYFSGPIDMDRLWRFFFETGFIYPQKYIHIQANKAAIKNTYRKLYAEHPHIARHFVYQVNGKILGHMAMLRLYPNTWLIHHHAANTAASMRAGLVVLQQLVRFINDAYRLASMHMNYVMCYFRPDNKFPNHVFGGAARAINDKTLCSVDVLAYLHIPKKTGKTHGLVAPWTLSKASREDINQLDTHYKALAGGLMIPSLELSQDNNDADSRQLSDAYRRIGLKRHCRMFSLKRDGIQKAVIMVNIADLGLNMSDLTNCMTVWVTDECALDKDMLMAALGRLTELFEGTQVPVLLFPETFALARQIPFEKRYSLWVHSLRTIEGFNTYIKSLLKFINKARTRRPGPPKAVVKEPS